MAATREAAAQLGGGTPEALYRKLSPGPGMSPQEVASHQCARIHSAMIEIVGERGYSAVTVRELSRLASVSTRTFYAHFEGTDECFVRTYDLVVQRLVARISAAQSNEHDPRRRLQLAFAALTREIEAKPRAAWLVLVEAYAAGPAALGRTRSTEAIFEAMVAESLFLSTGGISTSPSLLKGLVAGISSVARAWLLTGQEGELSERSDQLLQWALSLCSGPATTTKETDRHTTPPKGERTDPTVAMPLPEEVRCARKDDRALLLAAVAKLAAADGYRELTVPRIRIAAGVSRRNFNTHFRGVDDCFFAAVESRIENTLAQATQHTSSADWAVSINQTVNALCEYLARDPVLTKLAFEEIFEAGPDGMLCREHSVAAMASRFHTTAPSTQCPSELASQASVGAVWGVLQDYVTSGRAQQLPRINALLAHLLLAPGMDQLAAARVNRQARGQGYKTFRKFS